jgi:hypothetical protein
MATVVDQVYEIVENIGALRRCVGIIAVTIVMLTGCSSEPAVKGPKLISYADRQRSRIEPAVNTGAYGSIADKLSALAQDVYTGTDLTISETILNEGKPSKGIRLTVKGKVVSTGMIGLPKQATVSGSFVDHGAQPANKRPIEFYADSTGGWQASVPDIEYGSQVDLFIVAPALKGGEGDIQIFVYPMDKNGQSSAIVTHNYRVLDAGDTSNDVQVPVDQ